MSDFTNDKLLEDPVSLLEVALSLMVDAHSLIVGDGTITEEQVYVIACLEQANDAACSALELLTGEEYDG